LFVALEVAEVGDEQGQCERRSPIEQLRVRGDIEIADVLRQEFSEDAKDADGDQQEAGCAGCGLSPPDEQATMIKGSNNAHFITFMACLSWIAFWRSEALWKEKLTEALPKHGKRIKSQCDLNSWKREITQSG
jgi:hypothetical protein